MSVSCLPFFCDTCVCVCLSVCLSVCLFVCLFVCLVVWLVCLLAGQLERFLACLFAVVCQCLFLWLTVRSCVCLLFVYISPCAFKNLCVRTRLCGCVFITHVPLKRPGETPYSMGRAAELCAAEGLRVIGWIRAVLACTGA